MDDGAPLFMLVVQRSLIENLSIVSLEAVTSKQEIEPSALATANNRPSLEEARWLAGLFKGIEQPTVQQFSFFSGDTASGHINSISSMQSNGLTRNTTEEPLQGDESKDMPPTQEVEKPVFIPVFFFTSPLLLIDANGSFMRINDRESLSFERI